MPFEWRVNKKWTFLHQLGRKEHKFIKGEQFGFPASTFRSPGMAWTLASQAGSSAGQTTFFFLHGKGNLPPSSAPLLLRPNHAEELRSGSSFSRKPFLTIFNPPAKLYILFLSIAPCASSCDYNILWYISFTTVCYLLSSLECMFLERRGHIYPHLCIVGTWYIISVQ